MNTYS